MVSILLVTQIPTYGLLLRGYISNQLGRIGILWNPTCRRIDHVYRYSPANHAGLKYGDIITEVDGEEARKGEILGPAGTTVRLTIHRQDMVFEVTLVRVPFIYVSD